MPSFIPKTILLVNNKLIGDVVLTTPLIELFKLHYPDSCIDFLVNRGTGEFLEKDPRVRQVFYSDKWNSGKETSGNYLAKLYKKYDLAIAMNYSDRAGIATIVAGKKRIGYYDSRKKIGQFWRKLLFNYPLPHIEDQHVIKSCSDIARVLDIKTEKLRVKVCWNSNDELIVDSLISSESGKTGYFVIHPFARWQYKYWDIKRFTELSDIVASKYNLTPVWSSSPNKNEIDLLVESTQKCKIKPVLAPGIFNLNQMAYLIQSSKLYIGLDTAISHIAASTGAPMVALYGPTEMWRWHPWNNKSIINNDIADKSRHTYRSGNIVAMQAECANMPCIRPNCYKEGLENPCMMSLSVSGVCDEIDLLPLGRFP